MSGHDEAVAWRLSQRLRSSVNPDGGWGYSTGSTSRLEPTCWAALALLDGGFATDDPARAEAALSLIGRWQRPDGLLSEIPSAPPNLAFNGLAAAVVHRALATGRADAQRHHRLADGIVSGILAVEGVRLDQGENQRQDNQLVGWPWTDGMFSWVEPTSWCLLAAKKVAPRAARVSPASRIAEAERVLTDRCCLSGGWNYGNSNMLGKELYAYVPNTAVALLALQDRGAQPQVVLSRTWLDGNWRREESAFALSLALIAMTVHRRTTEDVEAAIRAHLAGEGTPANMATCGLTLFALTGSHHEYGALRL